MELNEGNLTKLTSVTNWVTKNGYTSIFVIIIYKYSH